MILARRQRVRGNHLKKLKANRSKMTTRILRELPDWVWDGSEVSFSGSAMAGVLHVTSKTRDSKFLIEFRNLAAYRFATTSHAKGLADDSICKVVEVIDSPWTDELREPSLWPFVRRHFAVFIEDVGYYEFLAEEMSFRKGSE